MQVRHRVADLHRCCGVRGASGGRRGWFLGSAAPTLISSQRTFTTAPRHARSSATLRASLSLAVTTRLLLGSLQDAPRGLDVVCVVYICRINRNADGIREPSSERRRYTAAERHLRYRATPIAGPVDIRAVERNHQGMVQRRPQSRRRATTHRDFHDRLRCWIGPKYVGGIDRQLIWVARRRECRHAPSSERNFGDCRGVREVDRGRVGTDSPRGAQPGNARRYRAAAGRDLGHGTKVEIGPVKRARLERDILRPRKAGCEERLRPGGTSVPVAFALPRKTLRMKRSPLYTGRFLSVGPCGTDRARRLNTRTRRCQRDLSVPVWVIPI